MHMAYACRAWSCEQPATGAVVKIRVPLTAGSLASTFWFLLENNFTSGNLGFRVLHGCFYQLGVLLAGVLAKDPCCLGSSLGPLLRGNSQNLLLESIMMGILVVHALTHGILTPMWSLQRAWTPNQYSELAETDQIVVRCLVQPAQASSYGFIQCFIFKSKSAPPAAATQNSKFSQRSPVCSIATMCPTCYGNPADMAGPSFTWCCRSKLRTLCPAQDCWVAHWHKLLQYADPDISFANLRMKDVHALNLKIQDLRASKNQGS